MYKIILNISVLVVTASDVSDSGELTEMCTQYLPVVCTGLQPDSNDIVVGPELQFFTDGSAISTENQQNIRIPEIMRKLQADKISAPS